MARLLSVVRKAAADRPRLIPVVVAATTTALAVGLVMVLRPLLATNLTSPFLAAIAVVALLAGRRAAWITAGLAAVVIPLIYGETHGLASLTTTAGIGRFLIFAISAIAVALVCGDLHVQRQRAEEQAAENLRLRELAEDTAAQAEEEAVRAEEEAARATEAAARAADAAESLRKARNELEAIVQSAPIAICSVDPDGIARMWNRAAEQVFGWSATEVIGKPLPNVPAALADEHLAVRTGVLNGQTFAGHETRRAAADGRELDVLLSTAPLQDQAGNVTGVVGMYQDVTERKHLEAQFRQAQKMEAVGRLAGGIAHDFNNVLTVIQTAAGFLLGELAPDDPRRAEAAEIVDAAVRAARLTRQLLAFSRQQVLQPRSLDLNAVVTGLEPLVRRLVNERISVVSRLGHQLAMVWADPNQLEQVILNLVVNARDAMPDGGTLRIETSNIVLDDTYPRIRDTVHPGPHVLLSVTDTGCGMDEATQARVFDPFFTTKPAGQGTGLGLASVYGVMKQSGGHIWVYSEPGKGATFKLYFPRRDGGPDEAPERATRPSSRPRSVAGATILLAEDNPAVRASVRRVLERNQYRVLEAGDGRQALTVLAESGGGIHLVLADMVMPEMDGLELRRHLRAHYPRLPVLLMSGYSEEAITHLGHEPLGPVLEKPFTLEGLLGKVDEMLTSAPSGT
jgi:PAS domain S-box-containing protein